MQSKQNQDKLKSTLINFSHKLSLKSKVPLTPYSKKSSTTIPTPKALMVLSKLKLNQISALSALRNQKKLLRTEW